MTNVAYIFPGQGAQTVGMGKELYDSSPEAKAIFDQADKVMDNGLLDVIFNGPQEKLTLTAYSQPAIVATSIAALKALEAHPKFQSITPKFTAGLSLGEYSALAAAGVFTLEDTLEVIKHRSAFMDEACKLQAGKMAAIIGFEKEKLEQICQQTGAEIANFNSLQQIVITGHAEKVEKACELIKEAGAKNVVPLAVSGAFHSSLMQPAAEKFVEVLKTANISTPPIPVISNVDANPATDTEIIRSNLAKQITSSVQWVSAIQYMAGQGITDFLEIGPGRVLSGLMRKTDRNLKVYNIQKPEDIEALPF